MRKKPNITIPEQFASNGEKTDFTNELINNGFDKIKPEILAGDNLNKFIDDTYKGLNGVLGLYEGIVLHEMTTIYDNTSVIGKFIDEEFKLYKSLQNNNVGHDVTDTEYWEELKFGGVSEEELINALSNKVDLDLSNCTKPYVVEVSDKSLLPSWYRIYSDGWCEQGCRNIEFGNTEKTITYLKTFVSLPSLSVRGYKNTYDSSSVTRRNFGYGETVEGFKIRAGEETLLDWEAKGYIS